MDGTTWLAARAGGPGHFESLRHHDIWRRGVFAQRDFVRLWLAQLISVLGGRITRTALPVIAVLSVDTSPLALGLLGALTVAPGVLVALAAGGMIDR